MSRDDDLRRLIELQRLERQAQERNRLGPAGGQISAMLDNDRRWGLICAIASLPVGAAGIVLSWPLIVVCIAWALFCYGIGSYLGSVAYLTGCIGRLLLAGLALGLCIGSVIPVYRYAVSIGYPEGAFPTDVGVVGLGLLGSLFALWAVLGDN